MKDRATKKIETIRQATERVATRRQINASEAYACARTSREVGDAAHAICMQREAAYQFNEAMYRIERLIGIA